MNNPKYLIIHHTGGTNANPMQDSSNYTLEQCNQDHKVRFNFVSTLGYYVGYQYYIDKKGILTQTRDDKDEGAHTIGKNSESLGICLAGNFDATLPTQVQIDTLTKLLHKKTVQYNIPPENIVPHRTFAKKTCYGNLLKEDWARSLIVKKNVEIPDVSPNVEIPDVSPNVEIPDVSPNVEIKEEEIVIFPQVEINSNNKNIMLITKKNKEILLNRSKSLGWRLAMMSLAIIVSFALANLELLDLPGEVVVVLGLILGEISKYLNIDIKK